MRALVKPVTLAIRPASTAVAAAAMPSVNTSSPVTRWSLPPTGTRWRARKVPEMILV
jgi:hypothetical protein